MKGTNYFKPYNDKKTTLKELSVSGVYFIKKGAKLVYIGYSETQLKKTIYRHLQSWKDRTQKRATYDRNEVTIKVIFCTPAKAKLLELYFIEKLRPEDNDIIVKHINPIFKKRMEELLKTETKLKANEYTDPF